MSRVLVALALAVAVNISAFATAFSIDQSDLWGNLAENGWGAQFVQIGSTIVVTIYVYGPSGQPVWYIAALEAQSIANTWSGDLFVGTGPWFGTTPFNPAAVAARKVGTMTWTALDIDTGTLAYVVDGVAVTKTLHRQPLRNDDHSGTYQGYRQKIGCGNLSFIESAFIVFEVVQEANRLIVRPPEGYHFTTSCTYVGDYVQAGRYGSSQGTFTCEDGSSGTHRFTQIFVQRLGWARLWSARLQADDGSGCAIDGHIVGSGTLAPAAP